MSYVSSDLALVKPTWVCIKHNIILHCMLLQDKALYYAKCRKQERFTSVGHKDLQCRVLQNVAPGKHSSDLAEHPFPMQPFRVHQHLIKAQRQRKENELKSHHWVLNIIALYFIGTDYNYSGTSANCKFTSHSHPIGLRKCSNV